MAPNFKVFKVPKSSSIRTICTEEEDEDPNHDYICHLTLPSNCPIKNVIEVSVTNVITLFYFTLLYRAHL